MTGNSFIQFSRRYLECLAKCRIGCPELSGVAGCGREVTTSIARAYLPRQEQFYPEVSFKSIGKSAIAEFCDVRSRPDSALDVRRITQTFFRGISDMVDRQPVSPQREIECSRTGAFHQHDG